VTFFIFVKSNSISSLTVELNEACLQREKLETARCFHKQINFPRLLSGSRLSSLLVWACETFVFICTKTGAQWGDYHLW
jgi:hypothetical protein